MRGAEVPVKAVYEYPTAIGGQPQVVSVAVTANPNTPLDAIHKALDHAREKVSDDWAPPTLDEVETAFWRVVNELGLNDKIAGGVLLRIRREHAMGLPRHSTRHGVMRDVVTRYATALVR